MPPPGAPALREMPCDHDLSASIVLMLRDWGKLPLGCSHWSVTRPMRRGEWILCHGGGYSVPGLEVREVPGKLRLPITILVAKNHSRAADAVADTESTRPSITVADRPMTKD